MKYWFKAKNYGWGWCPARWQGWMILLIYLAMFTYLMVTESELYMIKIFFITVILIFICFKTGEKPGWRWGKK